MKSIVLLFLVTLTFNVFAAKAITLFDVAKDYQQADYVGALEKIKRLPREVFKKAAPNYIQGVCYFQLQQYEKANESFKKVLGYREHPQETHYFYGQSLLALGKQKDAKDQFDSSFRSDYRKPYSKYYSHYIDKNLHDIRSAIKGFEQIAGNEEFEVEIRQPARYEMAKIMWEVLQNKEKVKKHSAKKVYKQLKLAYNMNTNSAIASDIQADMFKIDSSYKLGKESYTNGQKIPKKISYIRFYEHLFYDTNVATLSANSANNTPTKTTSMISNTYLQASHRFTYNGNITVQPEFDINYLKHTNTSSELVYQNDSVVYGLALVNSYKHQLFGAPSSFLFDVMYNSNQRDRDAQKTLKLWGTNTSYTIGESFSYFTQGTSQVRLKYNTFAAYDKSLNNASTSLTLSQFWKHVKGRSFLFTFDYTTADAVTDTSDTNSYMFRTDYIMPELINGYNFTAGMAVSFTDPVNMRDQRGLEKMYNPSLKIAKNFKKVIGHQDITLAMIYNYLLNQSKDVDTYSYSKHELGLRTDLFF